MATIINNPSSNPASSESSSGVIIAIVLVVLVAILFFAFGVPALRERGSENSGGVTLPEQVDINVGGGNGGGAESAPQY